MDLNRHFFNRDAADVAMRLIGSSFKVGRVGGIIVETEAYKPGDRASHSFVGPTLRNSSMFGEAGHAYVYRSYGLHWCFNIVCSAGSAVLIRALEPKWGLALMTERRRNQPLHRLCAGPGCLTEALNITRAHDGKDLLAPPFTIALAPSQPILVGVRIGITKDADLPWRFGLEGSAFLSRKF